MRNLNTKTTIAFSLIGLFFMAATADADFGYPEVAPQDKIDLCVAEIGERANYDDATYVRHEVESQARRSIGHKLSISTLVYDEADGQLIREYRTLCAVANRPEPVSFRIRESK